MKKIVSLLLTALMAFSAMSVGAFSASAATADEDIAIKAGSRIYFDNTNTKWDEVYFYAWGYGYFGDFVPMEKVEETVDADGQPIKGDLYSVVVPQDVPAYVEQEGVLVPTEFFLFTNSTDWSGQQTVNMPVEVGKNTYTPAVDEEGKLIVNEQGQISVVDLSYTNIAPQLEILAAPGSKDFTDTITVSVYAFNLNGKTATYKINNAEPVEFTGSHTFTFEETTTLTVAAGDLSKTYTYTKKSNAVINVFAEDYTGNIYVYTFGGDRVGTSFNLMTNLGDGNYRYEINGSAQVIFTTSNNWNTARKFIIRDSEGTELANQEPLISAGEEVEYMLTLS